MVSFSNYAATSKKVYKFTPKCHFHLFQKMAQSSKRLMAFRSLLPWAVLCCYPKPVIKFSFSWLFHPYFHCNPFTCMLDIYQVDACFDGVIRFPFCKKHWIYIIHTRDCSSFLFPFNVHGKLVNIYNKSHCKSKPESWIQT